VKDFRPTCPLRQPRRGNWFWRNRCAVIALGVILGAPQAYSQTPAKPHPEAAVSSPTRKIAETKIAKTKIAEIKIKSFRIIQEKDGQAVEILSTGHLVPAIQAITDPDRLVIDLPNARLDTQQKRINVQADRIKAIRADQFQQNPPIARVVVDLLAPRAYTWDGAGNRIVVHLGEDPGADNSPFQAPTAVSLTSVPQPIITAVRAAGPLAIVGDPSIGSSVTAVSDTAVVRLSSGGELRVCPGTTVSVTPSQSRHNLMLSMNAGALEAHFALDASSDSVMTPDFRIMLVGPGEFHYAISADSHGNTCVRALPGNTASAIVSELLGDRTYQVRATDQLVFRLGQLDRVDMAVPLECGCPPPHETPLRAASDLPRQSDLPKPPDLPRQSASESRRLAQNAAPPVSEIAHNARAPAVDPHRAAAGPGEIQVQVEAPFVFHAQGPPPVPVEDVTGLPVGSHVGATPALENPLPPAASQTAKPDGKRNASGNPGPSRGFFRKVGGFFAALFR
jgi:hypothetical protein